MPTYKVTFEIAGSPVKYEAWYHDVIRNEHVLVMIYDTACVGFPRTNLKPSSEDIAVLVAGSDAVYVTQDPNISFVFGGQEYKILLIKSTNPLAAADA